LFTVIVGCVCFNLPFLIKVGKSSARVDKSISAIEWISLYDEHGKLRISREDARKTVFYAVSNILNHLLAKYTCRKRALMMTFVVWYGSSC
jgi:hypothetical protein